MEEKRLYQPTSCKFCKSKKIDARVVLIGFMNRTEVVDCLDCKVSYRVFIDLMKKSREDSERRRKYAQRKKGGESNG